MSAEIIDQANELVEQNINNAIQAHRINRNAVSAEYCEECGSPIPEIRRKAIPGVRLCIDCAELAERQAKQFRG